jgi:hypothetical protein
MRISDSPELFGGIVAVGVIGFVGMDYLRRRVLIWHPASQAG